MCMIISGNIMIGCAKMSILSIVWDTACKVSRLIMFAKAKECVWSNRAYLLAAPAQPKEGEADRARDADQSPH